MSTPCLTARCRAALGILLLLLVVGSTWAQETLPAQDRNWDLSVWVAGATGEENLNSFSEAQIVSAGVFIGRVLTPESGSGWRRGRLEYGFDVMPVFVHLKPQRLYGGGFDPVILRWNSSVHAGRVAPYLELGGGVVRTNTNFPVGDTSNFNFIARGGGGMQLFTKRHQSVDIGCRWWHISNANLGARNPEFNGIQLSLGYHWFK